MTHVDPTLKMERETVKADIFRQGHAAPTLGLEEWGETALGIAQERERRHVEQGKARVKSLDELHEAGLEDDERLHDKATVKARGFEDWKDGVPRGVGNMIGRNS